MPTTDILLATYDGARFLPELIKSLDEQTDQSWRVLVRDDGSTDDTVDILHAWQSRLGDRFKMVKDSKGNLGAAGNFGALLEASDAEYFLPCDQDDFWLPTKIETLLAAIRAEEDKHSSDTPIIVHTDLIVVDEDMIVLADSFWQYQRLRMQGKVPSWKLITLQNNVTGCAMIGNRALLEQALPIPSSAIMHDWWLALYASLHGQVVEIREPSAKYRQHASNTLGAQKWSTLGAILLVAARPRYALKEPRRVIEATRVQAREMLARQQSVMSEQQKLFLSEYAGLADLGILRRKTFPARHRLFYHGLARNVALFLAV